MRSVFTTLAIFVLLFVPQATFGGDTDDLKDFCMKFVNAWNSLDADNVVSMDHEGAIYFGPDDPFPNITKKEEKATMLKTVMASIEFINITLYNDRYKVVGDTGVSWGYYTVTIKDKGETMETNYARYTLTAVKSDKKWQILSMHQSAIPAGN